MKRIIGFLVSCVLIIAIAIGITNCASLENTRREIKYVVDGEEYYAQSIFTAAEISLPANPTRENYDFDGWYYDEDVWNEAFDASSHGKILTEDIIVYAKWVPHVHNFVGAGLKHTADGKFDFTVNCTGCGDIVSEQNVQVQTTTKKATCLEAGEIKYSYTYMENTYTVSETIEKLDHKLNGVNVSNLLVNGYIPLETKGVSSTVFIPCESTGNAQYTCDVCKTVQNINAIAKLHDFAWTLTENSGNYNLLGECERDGCTHSVSLDPTSIPGGDFDDDDVISPATCQSAGTKKVTYTKTGYLGKYDIIAVCNDVVIPKVAGHSINGIVIDSIKNPDGTINYYRPDGTPLQEFINVPVSACGETFECYYYCEFGCTEKPFLIMVYKNHNYKEVITTEPTCTTPGEKCKKCTDCADVLVDSIGPVDELGHNHTYALSIVPDSDKDYKNNSFTLTTTCTRCDYSSAETLSYNETDFKSDVTATDCASPDIHKITHVLSGASCNVYVANNNKHTLNGEIIDTTLPIDSDVAGVKLTANAINRCDELQPGYFICENCGGTVYVQVQIVHEDCDCLLGGSNAIAILNDEDDN